MRAVAALGFLSKHTQSDNATTCSCASDSKVDTCSPA